jgi:hypothetical protein
MKLISTRVMLGLASVFIASATAQAAPFQIGSFTSASGDYAYTDGSLTGTTSGTFDFDPAAVANLGAPAGAFVGATFEVDAMATGNVTQVVGNLYAQTFDGSFYVRDGASMLLQVDFTNAALTGVLGGFTMRLIGDTTEGTGITYTSDVFDDSSLVDPKSFTFTLTPTDPANALNGDNFANFTSPDSANFSTSVEVDDVPEPATMVLFGLGLLGASLARRRRS